MATVIATDGSDLAKKALDAGLQLAKATGDEVVIVTAWQIPVGDFGIPYASIATTELIDAERTGAERTLSEAVEAARAMGVEAITELREGSAAHEICEVAKERRARMVVLGSHGWGALRSALYGSVAAACSATRRARCCWCPTASPTNGRRRAGRAAARRQRAARRGPRSRHRA